MSTKQPTATALELVDALQRKAPEYLDLVTAQSNADFEKAFDALLDRAIDGIQSSSKDFNSLDENALSSVLALALTVPGLSVTREANSNGHVDLTIIADHCNPIRKKLGEAKIWGGPQYHIAGLQQLLTRYTRGHETRGLVIAYVKKKNIKGLIEKLREEMNTSLPCNQVGDTCDHSFIWSFLSKHTHTSGEILEVGHIGCNLCIDPA